MKLNAVAFFTLSLLSALAFADVAPVCPSNSGQPLPIDNAQVLNWKANTPNQFRSRGHIQGTISRVFPDATGHNHLSVQIGPNPGNNIEIIYNEDFGQTNDNFHNSQTVEACGDYITASAQAGRYPPSPDGALIHWVHQSPSPNHPDGFMMVDGVLYGQNAENAPPKH